ncbi:uncharacterized protein LOC119132516 isoform X2 [Syngnathus acus]|uniref:uncharacterized protein LOC119132516 isoform X2 n=1 Tax=Syngnathus acus TaxID=161584 RepID=UPI001886458A|nr:uncharacterized protein LOC119132516 isoform X2 [Syngnathus acus]
MLARCFMVITFLAVSTCPGISGRPNVLMVAPTIRVDGHPQAVVTIKCGDGGKAGVVVYWHTPFGPFHSPGLHTELNPIHMRQDGSLVVHNLSDLHQGLYYCLLQHDDRGSTLFPYELHMQAKDGERGPRSRRALGKQEAVSDEVFVAAVTTAVLLTFVFGFSAGALSRTPLLRCLRAITKRRRSPRQRRPDITMTTLTNCPSSPSSPSPSSSSSSLCPPAKPQRSFRDKRSQDEKGEDNPAAAYLETCDHVDDEKGRIALRGGSKGEEGRRWRSMEEEKHDGMMEKNEKEDGDENIISQSSQSDNDNQNQEVESFPRPRLSRVIRVYQYDQDGRRYSHLPDPEPGPTARTKQRSISLSHLNAIMDAASAGPMDTPPLPKDTL